MPSGANITDIHQSKAEFYISQDSVDSQNASAEAAGDLPEDLKKHYPTDLIASEKLKDVTGRKGNRLESHHQTILNLDMLGKNATVISRIIGASIRLLLVASVLQLILFDDKKFFTLS